MSDAIEKYIEASPGFFILSFHRPLRADGLPEVRRVPIIAWGVDAGGLTQVITPCYPPSDGFAVPILCPDGRVIGFLEQWDSFDAWLQCQECGGAA